MEPAQPAILNDQRPAVAAGIQVLAHDPLHDIGGIGRPKPSGDREGIAVETGVVRHLHEGVAAAEAQRRSGPGLGEQVGAA